MSHFNIAMWQQVLGDLLIIMCYIGGPILFVVAVGEVDKIKDDSDVYIVSICATIGVVLMVVSHFISAGFIK